MAYLNRIIIGDTPIPNGTDWRLLTSGAVVGETPTLAAGQSVRRNGAGTLWEAYTPNVGTVTSVAFTAPATFGVTGSPITGSGTIALSWANQAANTVLSGPTSGGAGAVAFRALVSDDIPNLNASKITAGTLPIARGGTNQTAFATSGGVVYYDGSALANDAGMTYDATNNALTVDSYVRIHCSNNFESLFVGHSSGNFTTAGSYNTGIGRRALEGITSGVANTVVGSNSGIAIAGGHYNALIGYGVGNGITSGVGNCVFGYAAGGSGNVSSAAAFGYAALQVLSSGGSCSAFGYSAGAGNSSGSNNTFVGTNAGATHSTGEGSTYLGTYAGFQQTTGGQNTYLGAWSGFSVAGAYSGNVCIGYGAGYNESNSNRLHIHNSTASSPTVSLIYGEFNNRVLYFNAVEIRQNDSATVYAKSQVTATTGVYTLTLAGSAPKFVLSHEVEVTGRVKASSASEQFRAALNGTDYWTMTVINAGGTVIGNYDLFGSTPIHFFNNDVEIKTAFNLRFGAAGTGSMIGSTNTQKFAFWGATPIVQPTTGIAAATFVTNGSNIADDSATWDGYTIGQVVKALRNEGLLA